MTTFYKLLDTGHGRKLEQFGPITVVRPEPQALWAPSLPKSTWDAAQATFRPAKEEGSDMGNWHTTADIPEKWPLDWHNLKFYSRLTPFRHLGCFPEQAEHWSWIKDSIQPNQDHTMLNLFGYTGVISLVAAREGASVTHVDASKKAIQLAKENAQLAGLEKAPIRWLTDDALAFAKREVRRGNTYHTIVLDPPKFGRGPEGEIWDFMMHMPQLADTLPQLLSNQKGAQVILTAYALRVSSPALSTILAEALKGRTGTHTHGELTQTDQSGRSFSAAYWARFVQS